MMTVAANAASDTLDCFQPASSLDYIPRDPLRSLQSRRLRETVTRLDEQVPMFHQRMRKQGLTPADVHGVDDLARLPFTLPADLSDAYPLALLAIPFAQVVRVTPASDTAGRPIAVAYSRRDLDSWTELLIRCLAACGIHPGDVLQNACGCELFADALALHGAAEALGATVIPASGDIDRQIQGMKDFGVSAICSTPSHFLHLIERAQLLGVDLGGLPLRVGAFVAESWSEATRKRIEDSAGIRAYDIHGLPEMLGPGIGAECSCQNGLHVFEDHFFPEIIDPRTGDVLPDGREGELVLTTLTNEAMPLVRYRTRDITAIVAEPCPCGRTMRRIRRIGRRTDDMVVIQGVNVFPSQIETALLAVERVLPPYQLVLTQEAGLDQLEVQIEVTPQTFSDRLGALETVQSKFAHAVQQAVGVELPVRFVEPSTIDRGRAPGQRVVDKRFPHD